MNPTLRKDADAIIASSLNAVLPDEAVRRALKAFAPKGGRVLLVAAGKAAWQMAHAAVEALGRVDGGVVVTKYKHVRGEILGVNCYEAGHPVPDENSFAATEKALELVRGLAAEDTVLFLLSGGGSALFEKPLLPGTELQDITGQLLASGADIVEMNTIRKRLSGVKGGRFAQACAPAQVFSIVLSDILGDPLDMIASGPAVPDTSTCAQALAIAEKYHLKLSEQAKVLLAQETPKMLDNVTTQITGSVRELCTAAAAACRELGYEPVMLTDPKLGWPADLTVGSDHQGQSNEHVKHIMGQSMEALIHHFKTVTEGFRVPPGQVYVAIESPKGELGCHLVSDGGTRPFRCHVRDPGFNHLQAAPAMCEGSMISDVVVAVASLDPVLGGVDR